MAQYEKVSAESYYGLATPPTSPSCQNTGIISWPLASLKDTVIRSTTKKRDTLRFNEDDRGLSSVTPPASPIKEKRFTQEKQITSILSENESASDTELSDTDEENNSLLPSHPDQQVDGADYAATYPAKHKQICRSDELQPLNLSTTKPLSGRTEHDSSVGYHDLEAPYSVIHTNLNRFSEICLHDTNETQNTTATPASVTRPRKDSGKPLSSLPVRRRPIQTAPAKGGYCTMKFQCSRTSPDRFIAQRSQPNDVITSFKVGKSTDKLSDAERITRSQNAGPDPFSSHIPQIIPLNRTRTRPSNPNVMHERRISPNNIGILGLHQFNSISQRQISSGTIWHVGGPGAATDSRIGVSNGRGGLLRSGTNAPLYGNLFTSRADATSVLDAHERRIALAVSLDQSRRVVESSRNPDSNVKVIAHGQASIAEETVWRDNEWIREGNTKDAPLLRDDFYCSLLAYSQSAECLAVGLGSQVYLWSEARSVRSNDKINSQSSAYVTSLSFSSLHGDRSILAIGRNDGQITLWSPLETDFRFAVKQHNPISCVSFSSKVAKRPSKRDPMMTVSTEELLVGDEAGCISIYAVEWPSENEKDLYGWSGDINLVSRLAVHSQQVCGLAWAPNGSFFASGGNDNSCCVFERNKIIRDHPNRRGETVKDVLQSVNGTDATPEGKPEQNLKSEQAHERHRWFVNAAVKAIAFCPWQQGLIAIGGGSNDRCIHFYHVQSGACLATIECAAQVTSLIWSTTRREIAATFGFPQPEHPYRIAVFSWPNCAQVVAIPWADEDRALYAIPYPGSPNDGRTKGEGGSWWSRTEEEGCIVIATSGASIKFHEVWSEGRKATSPRKGTLGGSDILELLHGIEKDDASIIR